MLSVSGSPPPGSTFSVCVFPATPSLNTVIATSALPFKGGKIRVGIEAHEMALGRLPHQPFREPRRHRSLRNDLLRGSLHRQIVRIFVPGITGVAPHPAPDRLVIPAHFHQRLPELQVLQLATLAPPASGFPAGYPG